ATSFSLSYLSWRRYQPLPRRSPNPRTSVSLRPRGARSSHWYVPPRASSPRASEGAPAIVLRVPPGEGSGDRAAKSAAAPSITATLSFGSMALIFPSRLVPASPSPRHHVAPAIRPRATPRIRPIASSPPSDSSLPRVPQELLDELRGELRLPGVRWRRHRL